jgi:DNA-directed RNA polymerase specialized sigma24 family protein
MLTTEYEVVDALVTYTDWWQPSTTSILQIGGAGRASFFRDGIRPGLLETLDARSELCRRMAHVVERDRHLLLLWYVDQLPIEQIAKRMKMSRRQCYRRRAAAVRKIVDLRDQTLEA